jgi:uncharacterized cupin superfamily protein
VARPNVHEGEFEMQRPEAGMRGRRMGPAAGARELGMSLYELRPGASGMRLHAHYGNEELFVVLEGTPTLRTGTTEEQLRSGDIVACVRGQDGMHTFENRSEEPVRLLAISTTNSPDVVVYPEEDLVGVATRHPMDRPPPDGDAGVVAMFRAGDNLRR